MTKTTKKTTTTKTTSKKAPAAKQPETKATTLSRKDRAQMFYALIAKAIEKKPNLSFEDDQTAKNGENRANFDDDRAIMLTYHDPEKKTYQRVLEIWPKKASSYVIVKKRLYEYLLGLKTPDFGKYFTKDLILARLTKKYKKPWVNLNDDQLKSFLADFIAQY